MWYNNRVILDDLHNKLKDLGKKAAELTTSGDLFNYEEQSFIRRVMKSILLQLKNKKDIKLANSILKKTEWLE